MSRARIAGRLAALAVIPFLSPYALAAAQRSFVSASGVDNPTCSVVAPCREFAAAVTATLPGGEVVALDSAGYGTVTITQSVSIIAPPGVYAGISVFGESFGVLINTAGVSVVLRGLSINGVGPVIGAAGIFMDLGDKLSIENCVITNFTPGFGVQILTPATVTVVDALLRDNDVQISAGNGATVNITHSQMLRGGTYGVVIGGASSSGPTNVFIDESLVTGTGPVTNGTYCIANYPDTGANGRIFVNRVTVTGCDLALANVPVGSGRIVVGDSMVTDNQIGFYRDTGTFNSLGTSLLSGNGLDTQGTITPLGPQ